VSQRLGHTTFLPINPAAPPRSPYSVLRAPFSRARHRMAPPASVSQLSSYAAKRASSSSMPPPEALPRSATRAGLQSAGPPRPRSGPKSAVVRPRSASYAISGGAPRPPEVSTGRSAPPADAPADPGLEQPPPAWEQPPAQPNPLSADSMIALYRRIDQLETTVEEQECTIRALMDRVAALEAECSGRAGGPRGRSLALIPNIASTMGERISLEGSRRPAQRVVGGPMLSGSTGVRPELEQMLMRRQWGDQGAGLLSPPAVAPSDLGTSGGPEPGRRFPQTPGYDISMASVYSQRSMTDSTRAGPLSGSEGPQSGSSSARGARRPSYPKERRYSEMPTDPEQLRVSLGRDRATSASMDGSVIGLTSAPIEPRQVQRPAVPWGAQGPHLAARQGAVVRSITAPRTENGRMVERIKLV